jgi:hypothetical protein
MDLANRFSRDQWREDLLVLLAGEVAQRRVATSVEATRDDLGHSSWSAHAAQASLLISSHLSLTRTEQELDSDEPFEDMLDQAYRAVEELLNDADIWSAVMAASTALVDNGWELAGDEFRTIVSAWLNDEKVEILLSTLRLDQRLN